MNCVIPETHIKCRSSDKDNLTTYYLDNGVQVIIIKIFFTLISP